VNKTSLQDVSEKVCGDRLTPRGRRLRVLATLIGAALLLAGTVVGTDDDFPFGPFKMYSTADRLDAPVADTRVEAVDATGRRWVLTDGQTGIRRAEIEGQLASLAADPARLSVVADAYGRRNPGAAPLTGLFVVVRWHELRGGRPTGGYHDETKAVWHP
jgi:hypothetical protein